MGLRPSGTNTCKSREYNLTKIHKYSILDLMNRRTIMKKIILSLMLVAGTAQAHDGYRGGYHGGYGYNWVAPLVIGGAVGYAISQPRTVYVQPQPQVIYVPQPQVTTPYGYHYENILDANCNCYRTVLIPN